MTNRASDPKNAVNQTSRKSLKAHHEALKEGRHTRGIGIIMKHESERHPDEQPAIILRDVRYKDCCTIGEKFPAFKWIDPSVLPAPSATAVPSCAGRSCAKSACSDPCVCDPVTLRCVRISI